MTMATVVLAPVRCPNCKKKLAERVEGLVVFTCPRCKTTMGWSAGVWFLSDSDGGRSEMSVAVL